MADSRTSFIHKNLIHKITNPLQLPVFTYLKKLPYFLLTVKKIYSLFSSSCHFWLVSFFRRFDRY